MSNSDTSAGASRIFTAAMADLGPFEASPHLAVALSGGSDSMALCLLADQWCREKGGRLTALSVDHGLRDGSAVEANQIGEWLRRWRIDHQVLTWRGAKPAAAIQATARKARYDLLQAWCRANGVLHLLLGHTETDQAETFLLRLRHGSGPDGLSAMSAIREMDDCRILRPLLLVPRDDLKAYLKAADQTWLNDPSNSDPRFERSIVRGLIDGDVFSAPALSEAAAGYAGVRQVAEAETDRLLARAGRVEAAGYAWLDRGVLFNAARDTGFRALARLITAIGGAMYPPKRRAMNTLYETLRAPEDNSRTLGRCRLITQGGQLLICREARHLPESVRLEAGERHFWDGRFSVINGASPVRMTTLAAASALNSLDKGPDGGGLKKIPVPARAALPVFDAGSGVFSSPFLDYKTGTSVIDGPANLDVNVSFHPRRALSLAGFCVAKSI